MMTRELVEMMLKLAGFTNHKNWFGRSTPHWQRGEVLAHLYGDSRARVHVRVVGGEEVDASRDLQQLLIALYSALFIYAPHIEGKETNETD
jgi:hypothetical protein